MGRCLKTAPNSMSAMVRDSTPYGVTPRSPDSFEGRNSINTCSNGASAEFISIYAKSRCQWNSRLTNLEPKPISYGRLKLQEP